MKIRKGFITRENDGEQIMVGTGNTGFSGIVRSNKTAAFIIDCLKEETSKNDIVNKMLQKYDVSEDVVCRDVEAVLNKLREIRALEE